MRASSSLLKRRWKAASALIRAHAVTLALLLLAVVVTTVGMASQPRTAPGDVAPEHYLQILSPGPTGRSTHNQRTGARPATVAIDDASAAVRPGPLSLRGIAKGMRNVAVVVPAGGPWSLVEPAADGSFTAQVNIPDEKGPVPVDVIAWNSPPHDPNYTVELKLRVLLFVDSAADARSTMELPPQHPARGMRLVWSDEFTAPLSVSSSASRDAAWFAGGKPSSTGSQYSDALFVASDDPRKPFFQKDGFLRIRAENDPTMTDPTGWNRTWWSGHLSTGFPDKSASVELREGYVEVRMMNPAGPGAWPAFWMLDSDNTLDTASYGAVEIDVVEAYGHDLSAYMATEHRWPRQKQPDGPHVENAKRVTIGGNPNTFHTYGLKIGASDVTWYLDGVEVNRAALFSANAVSPFYLMLNLSMGGGWPIMVPPSGYYDLWVDYVRVYQ